MRSVAIGTLIGKSVDRTILILFKPFLLKKWLLLLLIASLAGAIGGGGNSIGGGDTRSKEAEAAQEDSLFKGYTGAEKSEDGSKQKSGSAAQDLLKASPEKGTGVTWLAVVLGVIAGAGLLALIVIMIWVGARFRFVWYDAIVKNDASIREPLRKYKSEGASLFKFFIIILAAALLFFAVIGLWVFLAGSASGVFTEEASLSFKEGVKIFLLPLLALVIGVIALIILDIFIDDFVVSIMAIDRSAFLSAWRKFMNIAQRNKKDITLYIFVLIGLVILSGALTLIMGLLCMIAILIAGGLLFGLPYLLIVTFLKLKILYFIIAIVMGIPFIAGVFLLLLSIHLPFAVFFRSFSLYFLTSLQEGYSPLPLDDNGQPQSSHV